MGPQVAPLGPLLLARGRPPGVCCWYFFVTFLFILIFLTKHIFLYRKSLSGLVVSRLLPAEFDQTCVFYLLVIFLSQVDFLFSCLIKNQ